MTHISRIIRTRPIVSLIQSPTIVYPPLDLPRNARIKAGAKILEHVRAWHVLRYLYLARTNVLNTVVRPRAFRTVRGVAGDVLDVLCVLDFASGSIDDAPGGAQSRIPALCPHAVAILIFQPNSAHRQRKLLTAQSSYIAVPS